MHVNVILSDGNSIPVRVLGIFELDSIPMPQTGRFTYTIELVTGKTEEVEFEIERWEEPPQKPDIPENEIIQGTPAWYDLRTWKLYQAALLHEKKRIDEALTYTQQVAEYIYQNCLSPEDREKIVNELDWREVYSAALIPPLTMDLIRETLRSSFQADYGGLEVLDALQNVKGGKGSYNAIKLWENKLMIRMRMTEVEYATLPLPERARKVCALLLDDWLQALATDEQLKKMERERLKAK